MNFVRVDVFARADGRSVERPSRRGLPHPGRRRRPDHLDLRAHRHPGRDAGRRARGPAQRARVEPDGRRPAQSPVRAVSRHVPRHRSGRVGTTAGFGSPGSTVSRLPVETRMGPPTNIDRALNNFLKTSIGPDDLLAAMTPEMDPSALTFIRRPESIEAFLGTTWARRFSADTLDPVEERYFSCYPPDDPGNRFEWHRGGDGRPQAGGADDAVAAWSRAAARRAAPGTERRPDRQRRVGARAAEPGPGAADPERAAAAAARHPHGRRRQARVRHGPAHVCGGRLAAVRGRPPAAWRTSTTAATSSTSSTRPTARTSASTPSIRAASRSSISQSTISPPARPGAPTRRRWGARRRHRRYGAAARTARDAGDGGQRDRRPRDDRGATTSRRRSRAWSPISRTTT